MRPIWSLYLRMLGWTHQGSFPYHLKKAVVIIGPHTSAWDFVIGLAFRSKLHLQHLTYLGKDSLFKGPFGFFFRKLGGFPVDRSGKHNVVEQVVGFFHANESFVLALSPEGTRKKVDRLRTGFYHIAKKVGVPIVMVGMDFTNKQLLIAEPFLTSDDEAADFQRIYQFYAPIEGKIPGQGMADLLSSQP
ncbi:MAG: 1-acyl-sn-glycerol-3-phosphate acyltransferase [Bacteroidota bacterium]